MSQSELLKKLIRVLNQSEIPYMLTGSIVSSLQGEPRATHDIDVVILIGEDDILKLSSSFEMPAYLLDRDCILEAIRNQTMFNMINLNEGDKVDFWILTNDEFDQSRFQRRIKVELFGEKAAVSTPEDTILAKLLWAKLCGGSEKQCGDALRIYEVQFGKLDHQYLEKWAIKLGVDTFWEKIRQEAIGI